MPGTKEFCQDNGKGNYRVYMGYDKEPEYTARNRFGHQSPGYPFRIRNKDALRKE